MSHTIIDLPSVRDDGRLYRDTALNFVESLIPNPWNSCHAPDLLELENGDLLCCWFAGSCEGNADVSGKLQPPVLSLESHSSSLKPSIPFSTSVFLW